MCRTLPILGRSLSSVREQSKSNLHPIASAQAPFAPFLAQISRLLSSTQGFSRYSRSISSCMRHQTTKATKEDKSSLSLQPPTPSSKLFTFYSFFPQSLPAGPPPSGSFNIDLRTLRREFLQLQAQAHPDLASFSDKKRAEVLSAEINEAYKVLSSPLLRAQHLLTMRGYDKDMGEEGKTDDVELLTEVVEIHHEIEEAKTENKLEEIHAKNEIRIKGSVKKLDRHFQKDDMNAAKQEAMKLKYWFAIREKIHAWEI